MIVIVVGSTPEPTLEVVEELALLIDEDRASEDKTVLLEESLVVGELYVDVVGVGRQEQADEILDGSSETPEQCETNVGRLIVTVFSTAVYVAQNSVAAEALKS
jgi:hypothetical protein